MSILVFTQLLGPQNSKQLDLPRNDNVGQNSYDTIELFTDEDADIAIHYCADRSNVPEGSVLETSLTQEAGFVDFLVAAWKKMKLMQFSPPLVSNHLRLVLQEMQTLRFYSRNQELHMDSTPNVIDASSSCPADPPNTLILIAGVGRIESINYASTFTRWRIRKLILRHYILKFRIYRRYRFKVHSCFPQPDSAELIYNPEPGGLTQILDNTPLSIVEIILDIGNILNGIQSSRRNCWSSGGTIQIDCYSQVRITYQRTSQSRQRGWINIRPLLLNPTLDSYYRPYFAGTG